MQDSVYAKKFNLLRLRVNNYIVEYNTLDNIISTFVIGDRKLFTLLKQYNEVVFMNSSYIVLVQDDSAEQASEQGRLYISDLIASQRNHSIEESLLMQKQAKKSSEPPSL